MTSSTSLPSSHSEQKMHSSCGLIHHTPKLQSRCRNDLMITNVSSFSIRMDCSYVRAPQRKRPQRRIIQPPPAGIDVSVLASRVSYVGSPEHKTRPSFAGMPRPRADATKCDTELNDCLKEIQQWLRRAFKVQCFGGPWEGDFPRYAWCKVGEIVYEARLVNRGNGQYKGWLLEPEEWPDGISDFDWHE